MSRKIKKESKRNARKKMKKRHSVSFVSRTLFFVHRLRESAATAKEEAKQNEDLKREFEEIIYGFRTDMGFGWLLGDD